MEVMKALATCNTGLIPGPFSLTRTGLVVDGDPTAEEWERAGDTLSEADGALQWWIGDWLLHGDGKPEWGDKYEAACEKFGREYQTLADYKSVAQQVKFSLRNENLSWMHHRCVAPLPPREQKKWLAKAEKEGWSAAQLRREIAEANPPEELALPDGKYKVLYADPPWSYNDKCETGAIQSGGCETHYNSMTIDRLCNLPVRDMAAGNSVLFLWVTSPLLNECFAVIDAWGFDYKSSFVWDKVKHNMGHYNSVRHELLLICTRGSCVPEHKKLFDSVVEIERSNKHSEKPERFRDIIDTLYPHGKRIELFARTAAKGWERWGNEAQ